MNEMRVLKEFRATLDQLVEADEFSGAVLIAKGSRKPNLFLWVAKGGPSGGGFSTVEDLFKFSLAVNAHLLLSPTSTTLLFTGRVERPDKPGAMYAYGWENRMVNGHRIVGHSGAAWGASTHFDLYLDLGYTVVILANYDAPIAPRLASDLRRQLTS